MNSSLFTADRGTHLKIVMVALVAAIVVTTVAFTARFSDPATLAARHKSERVVVKAAAPARYSIRDAAAIR